MERLSNLRRRAGELRAAAVGRTRASVEKSSRLAGEAYTAALNWKNNSELSNWLTEHLSHQHPTIASKAMDAEYLRSHIGGSWHRLYDGGHTLAGSWKAVADTIPDSGALDRVGEWANEYWKDLITTRGMPIVMLDHTKHLDEYLKHLDCVNVAQLIGGEVSGVSIYCNWNDPAKLVASAAAMDCSGLAYANIIAPLVSVIALGRAYFLLKGAEQESLQTLISPALRGLSRSGSTILLIAVVPGGFLLHLSCGVVVGFAHTYAWDKVSENKEALFGAIVKRLKIARDGVEASPSLPPPSAGPSPATIS
jgi:hypothetical protein